MAFTLVTSAAASSIEVEIDEIDQTLDSQTEDVTDKPTVRASKKKRIYWEDYEVTEVKGKKRAKCNYCPKSYACDSREVGTKNVLRHWESCKYNPRNQGEGTQTQITLENCGDRTVKIKNWKYDPKDIRDSVVEMIIIDEEPFKAVEKRGFRKAFSTAQPLYTMISRHTVRREVYSLYLKERDKLKELLSTSCVSVCLTTDTWTSITNDNYTCVTAHWVDDKWTLQKRIINFCLSDSHAGESIGRAIEDCLRFWDLSHKLLTVTVDNVGSNDVACRYVKDKLKNIEASMTKGKYLHVRCAAHIINLIVQDGITVGGDHIAKVRAMVKFVRGSSSRKNAFINLAESIQVQYTSSLKTDLPTRWNSTYLMLESVMKYRSVFERMQIPALLEGTALGPMTTDDWERCECLMRFLKGFYDLTTRMSGSLYVTSNYLIFHILMCSRLLKELMESDYDDMKAMGVEMKKKFDKYFGDFKKLNLLLFVAALLDPQHKMRGVTSVLKGLFGEREVHTMVNAVKDFAFNLFDKYKGSFSAIDNQGSQGYQSGKDEEAAWLNLVVEEENECEDGLRSEFDLYLVDRSEHKNTPVLEWWAKKVSYSCKDGSRYSSHSHIDRSF
ncbi:hypothetical protein CASFOL_025350 [Castilleja foliolosa]|uniref:hAT-like transposase RNase-H fold domain-containing protein n=1 Tax=Castilleja foliolosa TaxID=1961234 RepID=A0ABD3CU32_9LAMI